MTHPQFGAQVQRDGSGYVQMGGGYEQATAEAQARLHGQPPQMQQQQVPIQQQIQQGLQQQMPPQMQQQSFAPQQQLAQPGQRFGDPRLQGPGPQQQTQFGNFDQFRQQQQGQQFVQQLPYQQQVQAPQGVDLNTRLTGPNVPVHLQGRTLGEVIQIEGGLRQTHMQLMASQQGAPAPQQPQQQTQAAAQQPIGQNQGSGWDWRNPAQSVELAAEKAVSKVIDQRFQQLEQSLAPVVQSSNLSTMEKARDIAAANIGPAFGTHFAEIMQSLSGIDPRALLNPQTWQVAAERVVGAKALQASRQQPQQQNGPGMYPAQVVQPGQQPLPNLNTFFSEQPMQGGPGAQGFQLTPQQLAAANAMGMPLEQYAAYYAPVRQGGAAPFAAPTFSMGGRF